jgi:ribonuclease Z
MLPGERLDGLLLTHFHSDHIAEIPTVNLTSWVAGRQGPLKLYGPPGVQRIADG